jgi:hypothetical protein
MQTNTALTLYQYWNRLRGADPAPDRRRIEPYDIRDILGDVFIIEQSEAGAAHTFRLCGSRVSALFGRELRNEPLRDLFRPASHAIAGKLARNCLVNGDVVALIGKAETAHQRIMECEVLLLPLKAEPEGRRLLGCLAPLDRQFWHGLEACGPMTVSSIRVLQPDRTHPFLQSRPLLAIAPSLETPVPHPVNAIENQQGGTSGGRGTPRFTVIAGGKPSRSN